MRFTTDEIAKHLGCPPTHRDIITRLTLKRRRWTLTHGTWECPDEECEYGWVYRVTPLESSRKY